MVDKVINPETGRAIQVGGKTYNDLVGKGTRINLSFGPRRPRRPRRRRRPPPHRRRPKKVVACNIL